MYAGSSSYICTQTVSHDPTGLISLEAKVCIRGSSYGTDTYIRGRGRGSKRIRSDDGLTGQLRCL